MKIKTNKVFITYCCRVSIWRQQKRTENEKASNFPRDRQNPKKGPVGFVQFSKMGRSRPHMINLTLKDQK